MQQLDFEVSEFQQRLGRARRALAELEVDAMLVHDPTNIYWLTGWRGKGYQVYQPLILAVGDERLTLLTRTSDVPEARATSIVEEICGWRSEAGQDPIAELAAILRDRGLLRRRLGYDVPDYYLSVPNYLKLMGLLSGTRTANLTGVIDRLRYRRSPAEVAYVRRAAAINDLGWQAGTEALAVGKTELQVAAAMHAAMLSAGSQLAASVMNFASGGRVVFSHGFPTERTLQRGDLVQAEWGASYHLYHSTIGRMWSLGEPSARARELHRVLLEAGDTIIAGARPGARMADLHHAAMRVIGPQLERYAFHKTGYLIKAGFPPAWGDPPALAPGDENVLEEGMLFSVEPPLFIPEEGLGVRIIDNVLVTANGAERLTRSPREIVVV